MAHGYLGDGYGKDGERNPDGGAEDNRRGGRRGDWRGEWRGRDDRGDSDRQRDRFMFEGSDRDHGQSRSENGDRGFFSRTADEARDWFREDEHDDRPGSRERGGGSSPARGREQSAFSSHQDDHYLSWRQQQIDALDRDYRDYCRERQQQFHSDFNSWRRNRQSGQQASGEQAERLELSERNELSGTTAPHNAPQATVSPEGDATLGTNNPENSVTGRS